MQIFGRKNTLFYHFFFEKHNIYDIILQILSLTTQKFNHYED